MNFIFYQNILSIHQSAFLRNLADNYSVTLVVPEKLDEERAKHGWNIPNFGRTEIIINPTDVMLHRLLNEKDAIHVFSGIDSFELPSKAFKITVKNKLKIGVILEPFNWMGWRGKLRFLKYFVLRLKYNKQIDFILAIGNRGRWCYEKVGFSKSKIFDWGYFTERVTFDSPPTNDHKLPRIVFVGRLDENKNILSLISICKKLKPQIEKLQIIGDGPLKQSVLQNIQDTNFEYLGTLTNGDVQQKIYESDLLVLPSIYKDGWGAVVNEALMCGVPVITSDNCGSSVLLNNKKRGSVFSVEKNNLHEVLINFIIQLPYSVEEKQEIKNWALQSISGEVAADYFVQICEYIYEYKGNKPITPWLKDNL